MEHKTYIMHEYEFSVIIHCIQSYRLQSNMQDLIVNIALPAMNAFVHGINN